MSTICNLSEDIQNKLTRAVCKVHSAAQRLDSYTVYEQRTLDSCIHAALEVESALEAAVNLLRLAKASSERADQEEDHHV